MKKFTINLIMGLCTLLSLIFMAFSAHVTLDEQVAYLQKMLTDHYDESQELPGFKHAELNVTNSGFCRYKRYFEDGKMEYFSFNLTRFKDLEYQGDDKTGKLFLHTKGEQVIVQTYNDKKEGDVDSMATYMMIPVKGMLPADLTELTDRIAKMNAQLLVQK